jgi:hypothetical protein
MIQYKHQQNNIGDTMKTFQQIPNAEITVGTMMTRNNGKFISIVTFVDPNNGDIESQVIHDAQIPERVGTMMDHTVATAYAVYSPISELANKEQNGQKLSFTNQS